MSELSREQRWLEARSRREAAANRHPFLADATMSPDEVVVVDSSSAEEPLVLVAFPGGADRMGIPISEFFDDVRVPCHRVVIRWLALPIMGHPIGEDVGSAVEWLNRLIDGRPTLFVGHSLGGLSALLLGTLCGVDRVLAVNPTTSLIPDNLNAWKDRRYDAVHLAEDVLQQYGDIPTLWTNRTPVPTNVHFNYRDAPHRGHAEHLAEFANVELTAYYQYRPMYQLLRTGKLGPLIDGLLTDVALEALARLSETPLPARSPGAESTVLA